MKKKKLKLLINYKEGDKFQGQMPDCASQGISRSRQEVKKPV